MSTNPVSEGSPTDYSGPPGPDSGFVTTPNDLDRVHAAIVEFIRTAVDDANADGVVVAMSGGIDSTLTATLAVEALGGERVVGLGLPCNKTDGRNACDARTIAEGLGIEYRTGHLRPLLEAFQDDVAPAIDPTRELERPAGDERTTGNLIARFRMCCAYYDANRTNKLVLGTANRSEVLLGYFTKYGDGAADLYPIGNCYKTEVRALAKRLGLPKRIVGKEPTAGFWTGQTDADELGARYEEIDPLLERVVDRGESVEAAAEELGVDRDVARRIASLHERTAHKRHTPPTPELDGR